VSQSDLLRWLYLGRLTLVTGILAGALLTWFAAGEEATLAATIMFLVALGVTAASFWYTHILTRPPSENFLYAQVLLDVALVTGIVHITGGPDSNFAPLYILVISAGALLLPLPGGVLIGALASMVYFADLVWAYEGVFSLDVGLQLALFTFVALITGFLGDRLRRAGIALGAVESELRQLRLDTGDILANLATGVLTVDAEERLAYANPAAEALLGIAADEWMGVPILDRVDDIAPGMGQILRRAIRESEAVDRFRTRLVRDGQTLSIGVSTAVLDRGEGGRPSGTAIFQDITDLERIEALNRRTSRLEAVAELSASLAHEIKNPLASIRSSVEQLAGTRLTGDERQTLERLVLGESDRLSDLLSEFLDYSGLQLGTREGVDLAHVARDCVALVRQHPESEEVEIACRGLDDALRIQGDPDLLHRALFNLLLNAVQFSGPGGTVSVALEDLTGTPRPRGTPIARPVEVTVSDSGPGIDEDDMQRIFDPFFTTRNGGSGMGLAVVHRAVEAHSGAIFVERSDEGGARFVIYLPAGEPQGAQEAS
jgi:two-component system sensor histidine kinase PilS (NtrC family)